MEQTKRFRVIPLLLALVMLFSVCLTASAEEAESEFTIEGTTLVKYNGSGGEVVVPEGIEKIGSWAFKNSAVTKVYLPETLKEIESFCFFGCWALKDITLPASLQYLEYSSDGSENSQVFAFNSSLKRIKVAAGNPWYKSVDGVLFTADGKTLLYYPSGKDEYEDYAIPEGTKKLGYSPFSEAYIGSLTIPSTLVNMCEWDNDFVGATVAEFIVSPDNPKFYAENGILCSGRKLVAYPSARQDTELTKDGFPEKVTQIGGGAFRGNMYLKTLEFPERIKTLEWMACGSMQSLESVTIPASVESISAYCFEYCQNLRKVTILNPDVYLMTNEILEEEYRPHNSYEIFGDDRHVVLYGYDGSTVQQYAEKYGLPFESLGSAPDQERKKSPYTGIVYQNNGSTHSIVTVDVPAEEQQTEQSDQSDAQSIQSTQTAARETEADSETDLKYFEIEGTTLKKYTGPDKVVTVPDFITVLGEEAFAFTSVRKVILPEGLKEIRSYCFSCCADLEDITLPASLENLEYFIDPENGYQIGQAQVFNRNLKLKEIKVAEGNTRYKSIDGVLFTADGKTLLYYPDGKNVKGSYMIPEGTVAVGYTAFGEPQITAIYLPSTLRNLQGGDFNNLRTVKEINVIPDNRHFYSDEGILYDKTGALLCYPNGKKAQTLNPENFHEKLRDIASFAFEGDQNLVNVTLPEGLRSIGYMSFRFAESLQTVTIPESVTLIDPFAFADCPALRSVTVLNPLAEIPEYGYVNPHEYTIFWHSNPNAVLRGYDNSTAQQYAETYNIPFESIGPAPEK